MAEAILIPRNVLHGCVVKALRAAGADEESTAATSRSLVLASELGIDSHGVRLVPHYVRVLKSGRVNPRPKRRIERRGTATALLDADNGLGHASAYAGMELACELALANGVGAVGIFRSSHFAAAGPYAIAGAEAGCIALASTNADKIVGLHGSARAFHGTNPIAVAAPVADANPWLMELATSSMPFNRIVAYARMGKPLPEGVAADAEGNPTTDPDRAAMLLPLGGLEFGHKGAGLAGLVTVLCAVLTGASQDDELIPMFRTRDLLAPGDREWQTRAERLTTGIPVDPETARSLGIAS
jgi:ureidoglycolate dehydrogenase (NAD+)